MDIKIVTLCFLVITLSLILPITASRPAGLYKQADIDTKNINELYEPLAKLAIFNNKILSIPNLSASDLNPNILGENSMARKIEINLNDQRLYAYEEDKLIFDFPISSGLWNSTPNGVFKIWAKVKRQKMSGGSKENNTYYYLPNVPNILFFYNDQVPKRLGYSIHGAYWHNKFGQPMSHGCINMRIEDSALIYSFADEDTPIIITGRYNKT